MVRSNICTILGVTDTNSVSMDMQMKKITDASLIPNPNMMNTSCFTPLLLMYDVSESRGKVSYLPYEYLLKHVKYDGQLGPDEIENKKKLVSAYEKLTEQQKSEIRRGKYMGVPVKLFCKPLLNTKVSSPYFNNLQIRHWEEKFSVKNKSLDFEPIDKYIAYQDDRKWEGPNSRVYWMSLMSVNDLVVRFTYVAGSHVSNKVAWFTCPDSRDKYVSEIGMQKQYSAVQQISANAELLQQLKNPTVETIAVIVMYNSHFTSCFFNKSQKFALYFDSCGNSNTHFAGLRSLSSIVVHTVDVSMGLGDSVASNRCTNGYALNCLIQLAIDHGISKFYYNTFAVQGGYDLCGMYTGLFLSSCLISATSKCDSSPYITFWFKNDAILSMYRGCFYITDEDINPKDYGKCIRVVEIKNSKFKDYSKVYNDSIKSLANNEPLTNRIL